MPVATALAADWAGMATVSTTMGAKANRLCVGEGYGTDARLGCPSYAPSLTTGGHVSVTGSISAEKFIGDGSGLTGIGGATAAGTTGAVQFNAGGNVGADADKFFWNDNNKRLGLGTTNPLAVLDARATADGADGVLARTISGTGYVSLRPDGVDGNVLRFGGSGPAANILRFLGPSDAERMRIAASGRVGIGTATPTAALHVSASSVHLGGSGNSSVEVGSDASGNRFAYIDLVGDDTYTDYGLRLIRNNTGANATSQLVARGTGGLYLQTLDSAPVVIITSSTEAMRVTANGMVGIGTATPNAPLGIVGADSESMVFIRGGTGAVNESSFFSAQGRARFGYDGVRGAVLIDDRGTNGATSTKHIAFDTAGSERMRITSGGLVGIATTSPLATLMVGGASNTANRASALLVRETSDTAIGTGAGAYVYPAELQYGSGNTRRLQFAGYRRVAGSNWQGTGYRLQYSVDNSFTNGSKSFVEVGTRNASGNGLVVLSTDGVDRMWVSSEGVGIGNTAPLSALDVTGNISATGAIQVGSSSLACGAGIPGAIRYNSGSLQYCNGSAWTTLGSSSADGDRIVSGTHAVIVNTFGGYVSLSTGGTAWGYLGNARSHLPVLSANRVSSTGVSATYVQMASPTAPLACGAGLSGTMRYTSGSVQVCDGSAWGNIGIGVPTGTIAAFEGPSCPSGWLEYLPARGRFLRGIDNGAGNDPDGTRLPGNVQEDGAPEITGFFRVVYSGVRDPLGAFSAAAAAAATNARGTAETELAQLNFNASASNAKYGAADEIRPKNVAITYCRYAGFQSQLQPGIAKLSSLTDVVVTGASHGDTLVYDSGQWVAGNTSIKTFIAVDEKAQNVGGGTCTSGSWITRDLNTVRMNTIPGASLSSNQISLPAGTYVVRASSPGYRVDRFKARLYNVTDSEVAIEGTAIYGAASDGTVVPTSHIVGQLVLTGTKVVRVEFRCFTSRSDNGLGVASNVGGPEVYTTIDITKL